MLISDLGLIKKTALVWINHLNLVHYFSLITEDVNLFHLSQVVDSKSRRPFMAILAGSKRYWFGLLAEVDANLIQHIVFVTLGKIGRSIDTKQSDSMQTHLRDTYIPLHRKYILQHLQQKVYSFCT